MIGKFATSKAGHDKSQLYIIVDADKEFVYLCDGRLKSYSNPKKKRVKHIQIINSNVTDELRAKLLAKNDVRDEEIKFALKQFKQNNK